MYTQHFPFGDFTIHSRIQKVGSDYTSLYIWFRIPVAKYLMFPDHINSLIRLLISILSMSCMEQLVNKIFGDFMYLFKSVGKVLMTGSQLLWYEYSHSVCQIEIIVKSYSFYGKSTLQVPQVYIAGPLVIFIVCTRSEGVS